MASVLGSYFLPTELRALSAGLVAPEAFVRSLARPGQRGCVLVRAPDALGVVFLAGGRVVLACRQDGPAGGLEQVAPLFASPGATLWARLGGDPAAPAGEAAAAPVREPAPAADATPAEPAAHAAPAPPAVAPAPPGATSPLDVALAEARELLGPHAVRVESLLRRAEPTPEGLRAAAESLRERRVRLLSRATMELVSDRMLAALDGRAGPPFRS